MLRLKKYLTTVPAALVILTGVAFASAGAAARLSWFDDFDLDLHKTGVKTAILAIIIAINFLLSRVISADSLMSSIATLIIACLFEMLILSASSSRISTGAMFLMGVIMVAALLRLAVYASKTDSSKRACTFAYIFSGMVSVVLAFFVFF